MSNNSNASVTLELARADFITALNETTGQINTSFDKIVAYSGQLQAGTRRALQAVQSDLRSTGVAASEGMSRYGAAMLEATAATKTYNAARTISSNGDIDATLRANLLVAAKKRQVAVEHELAAAEEEAGMAAASTVPRFAASSAAVRELEGNLTIRAAERFISETLKLGPALQALFPVLGGIAFLEVLDKGISKLKEMHDAANGWTAEAKAYYKELVDQNNQIFMTVHSVAEGHTKIEEINGRIAELEERIAKAKEQQVTAGELGAQGAGLQADAKSREAEYESRLLELERQRRGLLDNLRQAQDNENTEKRKSAEEDEKEAEKRQREIEKEARASETAARKKQEALVKYNTEALRRMREEERAHDESRRHMLQVDSFYFENLSKADEKAGRDALEESKKEIEAAGKAAEGKIQIDERHLAEAERNADMLYRTHAISYQKRGDMIRKELDKEEQDELQQAEFLAQLYKSDPVKFQEAEDRKAQISERFKERRMQLSDQEAQHQQQNLDKIDRMFQSSFDGWIRGTETFGQSWNRSLGNMSAALTRNLEKMLADWITHYAQKNSISFLSSIKELTHHAMDAAGAAYKSVAAIPIVGPALAPEAAAIAFAAVEGFGSMASARGGMVSAEEQMAFIHKNEMVLPASLSTGFQSIIGRMNGAQAGGGEAGGDFHMHGDVNYNAAPGEGLDSGFWTEFKRGVRHGKHLD